MRIQQLQSHVINQIAAGEVIERPASVMKECLENALDAGADHLKIQLTQSGKSNITITDNGCGIHPDDLRLCVASHATSKITQLSDLNRVASLGFRGEALASISSISRFSIISQMAGHEAMRLDSHDDDIHIYPSEHPLGTSIIVNQLFYNTPARRKFLRSDAVELSHIEMAVKRIAISRPDLTIDCRHGDKRLLAVNSSLELSKRLDKLIGKQFMQHARVVESVATGIKLSGFIADQDFFRSQRDCQFFYLNQRFLKDRLISHAINTAYQDILYHGRQAGFVLYLEVDPSEFDVNVHPTKHEVRFHQPRWIHDFIVKSLEGALKQSSVVLPTKRIVREQEVVYQEEKRSLPAKILGQCGKNSYVLQTSSGLFVVNCLRLKRAEIAEKLQTMYQHGLDAKPLIMPVISPYAELDTVKLAQLGIEIDVLDESLILRKLPSLLTPVNAEKALTTIINFCQTHPSWDGDQLLSLLCQCIEGDIKSEHQSLLAAFFDLEPSQQQAISTHIPSAAYHDE